MPHDWPTTLGLIAAAACSIAGLVAALRRIGTGGSPKFERAAILITGLLTLGLFTYRAVVVNHSWELIESHVDGLLILTGLLAASVVYLQWLPPFRGRGRGRGLDVFVLPVLVFLTLWGVCASWWSFAQFDITGVWAGLHLLSVYLSMIAATLAAAAGLMYLFIRRQLRRKDHPALHMNMLGRFSSLESAESLMLHAAQVAFLLLSVALVTGFISRAGLLPHNMANIKLGGAVVAWLIFGLVVHVRWNPSLRGGRAATLCILGFAVLLIVMAVSVTMAELAAGGVR